MRRILQEGDPGRFRNSLWIRDSNGAREIASAEEAHDVLTQWSQTTRLVPERAKGQSSLRDQVCVG